MSLSLPSFSQQPSPTPQASPSPQPSPQATDQRVIGVVPAFNVASFDTKTPLTPGQKFHIFWRSTLDPFSLIAPAVKAGVYNAAGLNSGYGSGASGFFKRYGSAVADATSNRFFRTYLFPVALQEDPRYFRMGKGTKKSRTGYAVTRAFVTRTDAGTNRFNWSRLLASTCSAGLSNTYYPEESRGLSITLSNFALSYAGEMGMNVVKEFWPDIANRRKAKKERSRKPSTESRQDGLNPR